MAPTCVDFHQDWTYSHTVTQQVRCGAVNLYVPNDGNPAGDGAYVGWNIFHGNSVAPDDTVSPDSIGGFPRIFSWPDRTLSGNFTSVLRVEQNFIDDRILDTDIGINHPGGLFAPAWGSGNVQGDPFFRNRAQRDFSLLPGSPASGTAPGGLDYGATIPEWAYLIPDVSSRTDQTSAVITVGGPGLVAIRWRLDGGAWSAPVQLGDGGRMPRTGPILRQTQITLTGLSAGPHTVEVLGQDMAGNWQDADPARAIAGQLPLPPASFTWSIHAPEALVELSEISAAGAGTDWVELHNGASTPVDVSGWILADAPGSLSQQLIPAATILPAGARRTFSLNGALQLDRHGDSVFLMDAGLAVRDSITFGTQPAGYTLARVGTAGAWGLASPTPEAPNTAVQVSTDVSVLRITEVLAAGGISFADDWIELCSSGAQPVLLSGLVLTDNRPGSAGSVIPPFSYIGPGGCVHFLADGSAVAGGNHLTFSLDSQQSSVALLSGGAVLDEMILYTQGDDISQRRTGLVTNWGTVPTPGFTVPESDPALLNARAILAALRVSEIMYHAPAGSQLDWLELRNTGTATLDLTGVHFTSGIVFTFGSMQLAAGQTVVLVRDLNAFRAAYGDAVPVAGVYEGNLDNGGEVVELSLPPPFSQPIQSFRYGDTWAPDTDGLGSSLQMAEFLLPDRTAPERQSSWGSAYPAPSPGGYLSPMLMNYPVWKNTFGITSETSDPDGDGVLPVMEFALGRFPVADLKSTVPDIGPAALVQGGNGLLLFQLPWNAAASWNCGLPGVTYHIQAGSDLAGWTTLATKTWVADWTGPAVVTPGPARAGYLPLTLTDPAPVGSAPRYYRLAVEWME